MKLSTPLLQLALALTPAALAAPAPAVTEQTPMLAQPIDLTTSVAGAASAIASEAWSSFSQYAQALPPSNLWREVSHYTSRRLVQTSHDAEPYWTTELGKQLLFMRGIKFIDVTDHQDFPVAIASSKTSWPKKAAHKSFLKDEVFSKVSDKGPRENLAKFTSYTNRHYRSATGRESQLWLLSKIKEIASADKSITVREFQHSWDQRSIIVHWPSNSTSSLKREKPVVILGAHIDSTGFLPFLPAPGADDDGSGTVTVLEAFRALLAAGWAPSGENDLELHFNSAEEGGLLGSQDIVKSYVAEGRDIRAMLQQDMTAWLKPGGKEVVGLVEDFTQPELTDFIEHVLVKNYLDIPVARTKLGYAASDHASWHKAGFPAAFAVEAAYDDCNLRNIHTGGDTTSAQGFSFDHLLNFVRLTAAFAVELV